MSSLRQLITQIDKCDRPMERRAMAEGSCPRGATYDFDRVGRRVPAVPSSFCLSVLLTEMIISHWKKRGLPPNHAHALGTFADMYMYLMYICR